MCELDNCLQNHAEKPALLDKDRRAFLAGTAALPLAVVLAYSELSHAAAATTKDIVIDSATGTMGALAMPKKAGKYPAIILIHEWWGLNDQIKSVAADFAAQGYIAFAIDLYGGKVAKTSAEAIKYVRAVDNNRGVAQVKKAAEFLRNHESSNGKLGTVGWCFGGGWSLNAAIATKVDGAVIYYGNVKKTADQLGKIQGKILGHFGTQDKSINQEMVSSFEAELKKANKDKQSTIHWYEANHAFANPTSARYDQADASLAWERTLEFFKQNLG